jgi:hypothetical protein
MFTFNYLVNSLCYSRVTWQAECTLQFMCDESFVMVDKVTYPLQRLYSKKNMVDGTLCRS